MNEVISDLYFYDHEQTPKNFTKSENRWLYIKQEDNFKYLWVSLNSRNDMHQEIKLSLNAENRRYYNIWKYSL